MLESTDADADTDTDTESDKDTETHLQTYLRSDAKRFAHHYAGTHPQLRYDF